AVPIRGRSATATTTAPTSSSAARPTPTVRSAVTPARAPAGSTRTSTATARRKALGNGRVGSGVMPDPTDQFVTVDRRDDGVAVLRLDRPKMNALSTALLDQLAATAGELIDDPPGAVVVWGGDRIFAAGADISEFGGPDE